MLVPVHRVRPAAGVRPDPEDTDQPGRSDVRTEPGPSELGGESFDLLPLLRRSGSHPQVNLWELRASRVAATLGLSLSTFSQTAASLPLVALVQLQGPRALQWHARLGAHSDHLLGRLHQAVHPQFQPLEEAARDHCGATQDYHHVPRMILGEGRAVGRPSSWVGRFPCIYRVFKVSLIRGEDCLRPQVNLFGRSYFSTPASGPREKDQRLSPRNKSSTSRCDTREDQEYL